ncbi:Hypothetical protein GLP15_2466 [Giardia lamblia P15]|uniref:Uncharacterized protein n=1 Tax=Giardia intestinalis (strain P15) TaxID=658858 RepID=E1F8Q7_GIAIA|nr:Hypothetical protein GLP15_2466 [Giardia lamblia P15]
MDPRPDLFLAGMAKGSGCDFIRSVLAPSFQQYFEGLTGSGIPGTAPAQALVPGESDQLRQLSTKDVASESRNDLQRYACSVSTQTDPIRNETKFDPISIFYESIQTAPSAREISARVRAECTKEHRIALEQALQSLTAEHKLALNAITNVLNAERNARAAEREHYEADRRVMLAEQKRLEDTTKAFTSRQEDLAQRELAVQARETDISSMTKQILSREETIATIQAENKDLRAKIADLQSVIDSSNDQKKATDNEIAVMQRRIIALEETLKLYESVARYYSSQVGMPGAPAPVLPPCLPFPPTADSRPTGHFRQLQNAPPEYSPFANIYLPEPSINVGPSPNMHYESGLSDEGNSGSYQGSQDNNYLRQQHLHLRQQQHQASRPISHFNPGTAPPPMYSNPRHHAQGQPGNYVLRQSQQFEEYNRLLGRPTVDRQSQFRVPPNPNLIYQGTPAPELQNTDPDTGFHGAYLANDIYLSDPRSDATPLKDPQQPSNRAVGYSVFPIIDGFSPSRASTLQTTVRPGSAPPCGELPDRPSYKSTMSVKAFGDSKIGSISQSKAQVHALEEAFSESPDPATHDCNALSPINRDLSGRTSLSKLSEKSHASDPAVDVGRYSDSLQKSPIKQQVIADDGFKNSSPIRKSVTIVEAAPVNGSALKETSYQYSMTFDESAHSDLATSRQSIEPPRSQLSTTVHTVLTEEKQPSVVSQKAVTRVTAGGMTYTVHHSPTNSTSASAMDQKSAYENISYANDFDDFSDVGLWTSELAANNSHVNPQGGGISRSPSTNLYGDLGPVEIAFDDF